MIYFRCDYVLNSGLIPTGNKVAWENWIFLYWLIKVQRFHVIMACSLKKTVFHCVDCSSLTTKECFVKSPSMICPLDVQLMKLCVWFKHFNTLTFMVKCALQDGNQVKMQWNLMFREAKPIFRRTTNLMADQHLTWKNANVWIYFNAWHF